MKRSLYMKILVPIDGSQCSNKALLHACEFAKTNKANLSVIYVVDKDPLNLLDRKELSELLRNVGRQVLKKAGQITVKEGVKSTKILKEGKVANEIIKYAKNERINLIVVGSRGMGPIAKFLLGSVSNKLANHAECSVLIVK